jgi:antitoxin (DNA-binding transcriptional repressor) of toxin-antitoxin stability system
VVFGIKHQPFTAIVCYKVLRDNLLMTQVSIEEMQRDLSACLQRVEAGETLLIVRAGKPVAEVKPVAISVETLRPFGLCKGEFTVPDDFDAPLPEEILTSFEGK